MKCHERSPLHDPVRTGTDGGGGLGGPHGELTVTVITVRTARLENTRLVAVKNNTHCASRVCVCVSSV